VDPQDVVDGTLAATPLPALLATLAADARTGVLRIGGDGAAHHSEVWLSGGRTYLIVASSSPPLSHVLYGAGLGPTGRIEQALTPASGNGDGTERAPMDVLLADHPEAEGPLRRLLHEHNLSSLFEMLVPSEAPYQFEAGCRHPLGDRFAEDTAGLVDQAERRVVIWRRIAARIPSTAVVFKLATGLPDGAGDRLVTADEWRFLACLDGRNTVADVISQTGESAFRVCSTLYRLLLENLIVDVARPSSAGRSA
jgi:hypothetical protein